MKEEFIGTDRDRDIDTDTIPIPIPIPIQLTLILMPDEVANHTFLSPELS